MQSRPTVTMNHLVTGGGELFWVAVKALLLYVTAIIGFRLGERRTLAEMSAFDFVAAVASGAILGRVPNASTTSYAAGAITLITILIAHRIVSRLRYAPGFSALVDHSPRLLVMGGRVLAGELKRSGLTEDDLFGLLRQHGVTQLEQVSLVIFERRGKVSVILAPVDPNALLVRNILERTSQS